MRKIIAVILLFALLINGCAVTSFSEQQKEENSNERKTEYESKEKISKTKETDHLDSEETKQYIIPQSLLSVAGITAEELVEDFNSTYSDDYYIDKAEVNENGEVLLTLTDTQRKRYMEYKEEVIREEIENAKDKEDISVEVTDDYKEMKIFLGENSNSNGFIKTYMMIATQIGIYQIISGCAPEEWGLHIKVLREGKVILDTNEPNTSWQLNNEDFGE